MIERRKAPRRNWIIGRDDTGRPILEWKVDYRDTERVESDPLARTYDFLKRLESPDLTLEDDDERSATGRNPYDSGIFPRKFSR
jgi:hypothetical protein